jgi:deoxyribose-phosphate aldolase
MQGLTTGAVCVYHEIVETAVARSKAPAFRWPRSRPAFRPASSPMTPHREIESVGQSRREGDRHRHLPRHVLTGNWQALYDEMRDMRAACGDAHVKAILATGELKTCATSPAPRWSA